jgi:hypothetical protein
VRWPESRMEREGIRGEEEEQEGGSCEVDDALLPLNALLSFV